ncbi:hypothetical protein JVX88_37485 [Leptolyngbya sp. 7M]|nr:hypothetical protein JVX88_37485 [Leptolyngbya sp. 7M]
MPVLTALLGVGLPLVFVDKSNAELPIPKPSVLYYSWETSPSDATSTDLILADTPAELDVAPELTPAETASETDSTIREPLPIDFSTDAPLPDAPLPDVPLLDAPLPDASSNSAADLTAPETTSQTPPASQPEEDSEPETAEPPVQVEFTPAGPSLLFDGIAPAGSGQTITDIEVRFFRRDGEIFEGHTRPSVFLREFNLEPGTPYDEVLAQQGLDRLLRMAIVRSASVELEPAANPDEAIMVILVEERSPIVLGLNHATNYIQDLLELLDLYQQHYPTSDPEIETTAAAIELEFLKQDLPKLLNSMKVGADRIQQIVTSLRTFSRMDEAERKAVNIHEGIDSTLLILQNRLKAKPHFPEILVIKEYDNLPLVECYAGQLNQVFMNILSNAIDALEEAQIPAPQIYIRTELLDPQWVRISILDNGPGISPAVHARIFDPFFTTKPIGKGTGMGMSISYQIITERHGGRLTCRSAPNQGAEFVIEIPVGQNV